MEPHRSLALLTGCLGLLSTLVALSTDHWFVAKGPGFLFHTGLWPQVAGVPVADYIHVTQAFSILAALFALVAAVFLALSYIVSLSAPGNGPLVSTITSFAAVLCMIVAMAVYTSERWDQVPHPQVQTFFSWSFYLGWVSPILFLCAGALSLTAHCNSRRAGYEGL
ncbi:protein NKG7 [Ochotona curzoniae]|uniref:protein NKG7 n=1 Tax=Ochotona curzoniae TaxID=130825 RepID=UPI001B3460D5|nr:protein NKG7 [Ochotona curzoniae]